MGDKKLCKILEIQHICSKLWGLFLTAVLLSISLTLNLGIALPFIRSLISCKNPPERIFISPQSDEWSGSLNCDRKDYVVDQAQNIESLLISLKLISRIITMPFLGIAADYYGRKKILSLSICGLVSAFLLMYGSVLIDQQFQMILLAAAYMIHGCTTSFNTVFSAIIADLSGPDERASFFTFFGIVTMLSTSFSQVLSLIIQKQYLTDYSSIFFTICCISIIAGMASKYLIKETIANNHKILADQFPNPLSSFKLLIEDSFLITFCVGLFLFVIGIMSFTILSSFTMSVYGWRQGDLQLKFIPFAPLALFSLFISSSLISYFGSDVVLSISLILVVVAQLFMCMLPLSTIPLTVCAVIFSISTIGLPAYNTTTTLKYKTEVQAQVQGLIGATVTLAAAIASTLYGTFLFNAHARGFPASIPFLVGAAFSFFGACIIIISLSICNPKELKTANVSQIPDYGGKVDIDETSEDELLPTIAAF